MKFWRSAVSTLIVIAMVTGVVVGALLADGRAESEAQTNDGGAWLVNRSESSVGHVNRVVGEVQSTAGPFGGSFDVAQSDGVVLVHDRSAGNVVLIDTSLSQPGAKVAVPASVEVFAAPGRVVLAEPETGAIWVFGRDDFGAVTTIDDVEPLIRGPVGAVVAVGRDGSIVAADPVTADVAVWADPFVDATPVVARIDGAALGRARVVDATLVGATAVVLFDDGRIGLADGEELALVATDRALSRLQQPGRSGDVVVAVTEAGAIIEVGLDDRVVAEVGSLVGTSPGAPIVHRGCIWAIAFGPAPVFNYCGRSYDLPTASADIDIVLVNGWVWVNDVDQGGIWFVREDDLVVDEIIDWTAALDPDDGEQDPDVEGGEEVTVIDPDGDVLEDPEQIDDDERNDPPVAEDDEDDTRRGQAVVVDVLANDVDPDNDPLSVERLVDVDAEGRTASGAQVSITADGRSVQVQPVEDFVGDIRFGYVVHDGRQGRGEAVVRVTVHAPDEATNRAPITTLDRGKVRAGETVSLNVLTNDSDPDGDSIVLVSIDDAGGSTNATPDGEITFTPDVTSPEGEVELSYTIADSYGAEAVGTVRISVRPSDSNLPPSPLSDVGRTSVGRPVIIDVLANDSDPDGDPLIAQNLQNNEGLVTSAQLSPDGRFIFRPDAPGTYRFTYSVSDGPTVAEAQIRVDVDEATENRPPIAVLDEVALARGEERIVRALDNDGDPDGDVVGIVEYLGVDGLEISEVPGVGFRVVATAAAPPRAVFRYWISDGVAPPVRGDVVVSVLDRAAVDYPPVAVNDAVDVRPGQRAELRVLSNDHDPEGGILQLVGVPEIAEGSVQISPDRRTIILRTDPDQQFSFQFAYDVEDPGGNRASAVVDVRIVSPSLPNRAPVAGPDVVRTPSETPIEIDVLDNDFDPDGDPIAVESIAAQPQHGRIEVQPDGSIVYEPERGFSGTDSFVYTLVDGYRAPVGSTLPVDQQGPARSLGEVFIGVMPAETANRPPNAVDDSSFPVVALAGRPVVLDVLANDTDPDADPLTVTSVTRPSVGSVEVAADGRSVSFTPPDDSEQRVVSFGYTIADGRGGTDRADVTLDLTDEPEALAPIAVDDTVGPARAGETITFDPRVNDLDPDGDPTTLVVESDDEAVTVGEDGTELSLVVPEVTAEIEYRVRDEQDLVSEAGYITVLVAENEPPNVPAIDATTTSPEPVVIDIGAQVDDPDGDPLVITLGSQRTGGSVQIDESGDDVFVVTFTPDEGFVGTAGFDITVDDRFGHTVAGDVSIEVEPPANQPPVAAPIAITADAGIPAVVRLSDGVADPDPDGALAHSFEIGGRSGPVLLDGPNAAGEVTVASAVDVGGSTATFDYTVIDGEFRETNTVTITLDVASFPAPSVIDDATRTLQGVAAPPVDLLANDIDNSPAGLGGDGLRVTSVGVTPAGSVDLQGSTVVFTPDPDFFGRASFSYTVRDGRNSVEGESTGVVTIDVVGLPAQPQPPTIDTVGNGYLIVAWRPPLGDAARAPVSGYVLQYRAADGSTGSITFDSPSTRYRWDGLTNATEYCFQVAAINEAGQGDFSVASGSAECGVPDVRPEAPPTPTTQFGDQQLTVRWSAPLNQGSPIRNYQLRISGGASELSPELGTVTQFVWTGLENGTDYTFEVRAQNSAVENDGWSDWSSLSSPEHPLTLPDAPPQPGAVRGDRQVDISWTAPADGGDQITQYQVRSSISPTWVPVTPQGTSNSYTWENIPNGTDVSFQVRAVNRDPSSTTPGNISPSSPVVRTCSVPDAPTQPTVVRGDRQVTVSWVRPADQGCAISEYRVVGSPGGVQTASPSATSHVFTGLTNGTASTFTVAAINEVNTVDGVAERYSPASVSVTPAGPPLATNVTEAVNTGPRQVRVSWSTPDDNGDPITGYQLSVNAGSWIDVGNTTSITRTEGSNGATYTYRVRAVNSVGPSTQTGAARSVTTWTVPGAPAVSVSGGNRSITASWNTPSNGGTGLTGHQAKLTTGGCDASGTVRTNPNSPETFSGLAEDTSYRVCVRYQNAVGWGSWGSGTARTDAPPAPQIAISRGDYYQGTNGSCTPGECRYVNWDAQNFTPGATYTYNVYVNGSLFRSATVTMDGSGRATKVNQTFTRGSGTSWQIVAPGIGWTVQVRIAGTSSPNIVW